MAGCSEDEFTAFVVSRGPALRRTAYLLTGNWHDAEDVVQTALARLFASWSRVRRGGTEEAFARRIVLRTFLDSRRRRWWDERPTDCLPDRETVIDDQLEQRLDLRDALLELPKGQRAIVVLRYVEDLSVEQVADLLSVSTGTVKSQSTRGLARMRELLGSAEMTAGRNR